MQSTHEKTITELLHQLLTDAQTLVRQEVALVRAEFREQIREVVTIGALLIVTAAALGAAALWLLISITLGLAALFNWPVGGVFAGVGIALSALGIVLVTVVLYQVRALEVLPKTKRSLRGHVLYD